MIFVLCCLVTLFDPTPASAWGYQGHKVVGSTADRLLKPAAKQQVRDILGENLDLRRAAPWLDCVKSVVRHDDGTFHYEVDPDHLEYEVPCTPFNSTQERARLIDYAKRNWFTCSYKPDGFERGCHNTFHYENVPIQRGAFDRKLHPLGTEDNDLVAAIGAAIAVLSDKPIPSPFLFSIRDKREALFLLAHLVGDLHQPLHVADHQDRGGNALAVFHGATQSPDNLHSYWDTRLVEKLGSDPHRIGAALDAKIAGKDARRWSTGTPALWAQETFAQARDVAYVFNGESFVIDANGARTVRLDAAYEARALPVVREQLSKAGVRLAALLNEALP
jgi:hypothetical protein